LGYGGYCFPKDVAAFEKLANSYGYDFPLMAEVARINEEAIEAVAAKIEDAVWNLEGKRIGLLGLSFKPGTDDVRFSPALALGRLLLERGAHVVGYDPQALHSAKSELPELELANDPYTAAARADCLVIATEWAEFADLDLAELRNVMAHPVIVDGRNLLDPSVVAAAGFTYYSVGRPTVS
jgi:UDPglucose 6-dehydrogenase